VNEEFVRAHSPKQSETPPEGSIDPKDAWGPVIVGYPTNR